MRRAGGLSCALGLTVLLNSCGGSPTAPTPLGVTCPAGAQATSPSSNPVAVTFATPSATGGSAPTTVTCSPASGSMFAVGSTTVTCTARDSAGRNAACSFPVTVSGPPNGAPVITALTVSPRRTDVGGSVEARVSVQDAETTPDKLTYEWTAESGTFGGQGQSVTWRAPNQSETPFDVRLTVTVVETYGTGEHRVSATSDPIRVHDSKAELTELAETFLKDFSDSSVPASVAVRNFSDSCRGKQDELKDIEDNRLNYVIVSSSYKVDKVTINVPFSSASIEAPCSFESTVKATGQTEKVAGTCKMTAVYEQQRWWLCTSTFDGVLLPVMKFFFGIR